MKAQRMAAGTLGLAAALLLGCDLPGRPSPGAEAPRPEAVLSFDTLYGENCAGCHGANGQDGPAANLANPEYEALIDDASLRDVISNGEKGSLMPAFNKRAGGDLADAQIEAILQGMRERWRKPSPFGEDNPPPYKATLPSNIANGQAVYMAACARCHGASAQRPGSAGSILDGSFLALIDEQAVRTTIIAGRPDIGEPDWRGHLPGRPMSDQEITDVSAWLIAQRLATPGQPYSNARPMSQPHSEVQPRTIGPKGR